MSSSVSLLPRQLSLILLSPPLVDGVPGIVEVVGVLVLHAGILGPDWLIILGKDQVVAQPGRREKGRVLLS